MARTKEEIKQGILASKASNIILSQWNNSSVVSLWMLIADVFTEAAYVLEMLFDFFKADVNETIDRMKPHSRRWYGEMAKKFQYGYNLVADSDYYNNTGIPEAVVEASRIIAFVAVVEQEKGVRIKVAKYNGTDLVALTAPELAAFTFYMNRIKDAGVKLTITSSVADELKLVMRVRYNPLVLSSAGSRIDGASSTPVDDAVRLYLKNLPFNGVYSLQRHVDVIMAVEGVDDLAIDLVQSRYGALPFTNINIDRIPDSGYLRIANTDLTIQYTSS
jgi:hypothetical protein